MNETDYLLRLLEAEGGGLVDIPEKIRQPSGVTWRGNLIALEPAVWHEVDTLAKAAFEQRWTDLGL